MVLGGEILRRILGNKAGIENRQLRQLLDKASTVSVSPLFQYICKPNQMIPIPWEHFPYRMGLRMEVVAMPNETRSVEIKPFG
jgi:glutathionylspermidine synthase